jgi:hypothetical protein
MDMENILHNYLTRLRIISKCPVNGRLDTTHNDINIYYGGIIGWMYRKAYGDNKENTTKYLIDLFREINSFSDQLMYNILTEQSDIRRRKKLTMLVSLTEKMKESLSGIRNLIGTYKDYLKIVSLLECLEQDLIIPQYRTLLKFIPEPFHTEILKTAITYSHAHTSGIFDIRDKNLSNSNTDIETFKKIHKDQGQNDNVSYTATFVKPFVSDPINIISNAPLTNISQSLPVDLYNHQNKNKENVNNFNSF